MEQICQGITSIQTLGIRDLRPFMTHECIAKSRESAIAKNKLDESPQVSPREQGEKKRFHWILFLIARVTTLNWSFIFHYLDETKPASELSHSLSNIK